MDTEETRGQRIARLREEHGWTRQELATYAGLANNTIWRLEQDATRKPQKNIIEALAKALEVTPEEINGVPVQVAPLNLQFEELRKLYEELPQIARDRVLEEARGLRRILRDRDRDRDQHRDQGQ